MIASLATDDDMLHVLRNLRQASYRELFSGHPPVSAQKYAAFLDSCAHARLLHVALRPEMLAPPAAIFTVYALSKTELAFQTYGTAIWPAVARSFIRWFNRKVAPALASAGYHQACFMALDDPPANLRWFALMNAVPSAPAVILGGTRLLPMRWTATVDIRPAGIGSPPATEKGQPACVIP